MSMSEDMPMASREEIAKSLEGRAAQLWGQQRADELTQTIEETAEHILRLSQNLPDAEEEPGFYF